MIAGGGCLSPPVWLAAECLVDAWSLVQVAGFGQHMLALGLRSVPLESWATGGVSLDRGPTPHPLCL
jgi:hypothetical protein